MSQAERVDHAIDELLAGGRPPVDGELRRLVAVGAILRDALAPQPVAPAFEGRLAARLRAGAAGRLGPIGGIGAAGARELRIHARHLTTGAVGSAAIGLAGVTAYAVWRVAHR